MTERQRDFLSELLQKVSERSRWLLGLSTASTDNLSARALADALLSTRGEASGVALARALLERWRAMTADEQRQWFSLFASDLGPDRDALDQAVTAWSQAPTSENAGRLHQAAEPRRQELFRRINLAPGGTEALVRMREVLLALLPSDPELAPVDDDFEHLFASWFNRGFLLLRRIDWSSPADILEKIIRYEAVHEIRDWDDLRGRIKPADRRCFAFFHPRMPDEPLVFVEVALTRGMPSAIESLIRADRKVIGEHEADTAVFYSISNTQTGLRGVSFGNFLIKQVVDELLRELPKLKTFATLSPLPGFAAWLAATRDELSGSRLPPQLFELLASDGWHLQPDTRDIARQLVEQAAAIYLLEAKAPSGKPADPVARFHLHNGARLERINFCGDTSAKGLRQSHGVMVNYLYDLDAIERNHEAYANAGEVIASSAVTKMLATDGSGSLARSLQALLPPRASKADDKG
jgi:malonyl-CoA decarboxylase